MFIDKATIYVRAGNGGNGCSSIYRDKYTRKGIPDGGHGGKGADIIIRADRNLHTLLDFQYNRHFYGRKGAHGSGKNRKGKDAETLVIRVPCGVIVTEAATDCVLGQLDRDTEELIVAYGGKGGHGNTPFREATPGEVCEEKELILDLKLIADVGVVGFPNAGKSTFVASISHAHPAIAAYPFTTKFPVLGVVTWKEKSFVVADIPGLIEGSSQGRGLGDRFLRHVERTKTLVHLVDMSGSEGRDPVKDYLTINDELKNYSSSVRKKSQIIVANKMDLDQSADNLKRFVSVVKKKVYPISALQKTGLEALIAALSKKI